MECEVANRMLGILHSLCLSFMICKKERFKWSIQWLLIELIRKERERERKIEKATKKARNNKKEKQISKDQFNAFY